MSVGTTSQQPYAITFTHEEENPWARTDTGPPEVPTLHNPVPRYNVDEQVYYLPYPCKTKANLRGWEVVFQVSPHGNLPIPSEDDYSNIDPVTYEGIFYQEQEDFGDFELEPVDLEDVANDETRGETVVNPKDIDMLKKFHEENDNDDEPPPVDEAPPYYSRDSDTDSENENEESDDEW